MKKFPLGLRLALWYAVLFALGELVLGVGSWLILRHNTYNIVDDNLERRMDDLKAFLEKQNKDSSLAELRQQATTHFASSHSGDFLQLSLETGELIYRSTFLESHPAILIPPDQIKRPIFRTKQADGRPLRFIFHRLQANGRVFIVEMGTRADVAVRTLKSYSLVLMIFAPMLSLIAATVGYRISRIALTPAK